MAWAIRRWAMEFRLGAPMLLIGAFIAYPLLFVMAFLKALHQQSAVDSIKAWEVKRILPRFEKLFDAYLDEKKKLLEKKEGDI